ncbi:P35/P49-like [Choristoneura occidentalis granulovirus]|uniref:P35/P49-like n=1 Tax=Choristoneura occidentalis granulovirus TaxID=364745 RepID=Q1A4T1_9BBAC|nr:P35/P49-like [Choristoneura fumiferana granulovirus]ABC61149.1 P35/P49-like [Choristoneura fumiferana granulovirus]
MNNMCILMPGFEAHQTVILDQPNLENRNFRDIVYINNVSHPDLVVNKNAIMAFIVSGEVKQVKEVTTEYAKFYKQKYDNVFSTMYENKCMLDCSNDISADEFISNNYIVVAFKLQYAEEKCVEYLNKWQCEEDEIVAFKNNCIPILMSEKLKSAYVVLCCLKPELLNEDCTVCVTYEPVNNIVIIPLQHEISEKYKYDVLAIVRGVGCYKLPLATIRNLKDVIKRLIQYDAKVLHELPHVFEEDFKTDKMYDSILDSISDYDDVMTNVKHKHVIDSLIELLINLIVYNNIKLDETKISEEFNKILTAGGYNITTIKSKDPAIDSVIYMDPNNKYSIINGLLYDMRDETVVVKINTESTVNSNLYIHGSF